MSRARAITLPDGTQKWFDVKKNGQAALDWQIELLSVIEEVDLDDLLDAVITQGEVITRLRVALGQSGVIPTDVLIRIEEWRAARQLQPACRKCDKEGDSTKHHFVNKWILRELSDYTQKWADRSKNCIPLCIDCHRRIHQRYDLDGKSIADLLSEEERKFADAALTALSEQRPKLLILIARGDDSTYETRLVRDWLEGRFDTADDKPWARHLRAVV